MGLSNQVLCILVAQRTAKLPEVKVKDIKKICTLSPKKIFIDEVVRNATRCLKREEYSNIPYNAMIKVIYKVRPHFEPLLICFGPNVQYIE